MKRIPEGNSDEAISRDAREDPEDIRHFGKLPFQERPLESFQPPEVESFESFMERYRQS